MPPQQNSAPDFIPADSGTPDFIPADTTQKPPNASSAALFGAGGREAPTPGLFSRLKQAMAIPTSMADLKAMIPSTAPAPGAAGIRDALINSAAGPAAPAVHNVIDQGRQMISNLRAGASPVAEIPKFLLNGPLAPFGGGAVNNFAEDVGGHMNAGQSFPKAMMHGDVAGDMLGTALNLLLTKAAMGPTPEARLNSLTAAGGAKTATPFERVAQPLRDTADAAGIQPHTVKDVLDVVNKFKDNVNAEYGNALGPHANTPIFPQPVSQRILDLITPDMQYTREGRAEIKEIQNAAIEYQKPWTLGALDSKRSRLAADLASHNAKEPVSRYTAERGSIKLAIDNAAMGGLRDTVYPQADVLAGKPPGYFENLKQQQSAAIRLESLLNKRVEDLVGKSREAKGQSFMSRVRPGAAVSGEGTPHGYVSNLGNAVVPRDVLKQANRAAGAGFSTGGPVSKAFVLSYPARWALMQPPMVADPNAPPQ